MKKRKWFGGFGVLLMAWILVQPAAALAQSNQAPAAPAPKSPEYDQGFADGKKAAIDRLNENKDERKVMWFFIGFTTGLIGTAAGYIHQPNDIAVLYMKADASPDYKQGFSKGFCKTLTEKRTGYALIGWVCWVPIGLALSAKAQEEANREPHY